MTWRPAETAPKDGTIFTGRVIDTRPYRWKAYSQEHVRRFGKAGRWQRMNNFGGWDNCELPDDWIPIEETP